MEKSEVRLEILKLVQRIKDMTNEEFAEVLGIAPTYWATIKSGKAPLNGDYVLKIQDLFPDLYKTAQKILSLNLQNNQEVNTK